MLRQRLRRRTEYFEMHMWTTRSMYRARSMHGVCRIVDNRIRAVTGYTDTVLLRVEVSLQCMSGPSLSGTPNPSGIARRDSALSLPAPSH